MNELANRDSEAANDPDMVKKQLIQVKVNGREREARSSPGCCWSTSSAVFLDSRARTSVATPPIAGRAPSCWMERQSSHALCLPCRPMAANCSPWKD